MNSLKPERATSIARSPRGTTAIAENFRQKIETKEDLARVSVLAIFRDQLNGELADVRAGQGI